MTNWSAAWMAEDTPLDRFPVLVAAAASSPVDLGRNTLTMGLAPLVPMRLANLLTVLGVAKVVSIKYSLITG